MHFYSLYFSEKEITQMKYELHGLDKKRLPFIIRQDVIRRDMKDFTHWHENIELLYFIEGEGRVVCNFSSYSVKKGDIFVVNSENLHMVESDKIIKYYCIIIDNDFCAFNGIPAEELRFVHIINNPALTKKYQSIIDHYECGGEQPLFLFAATFFLSPLVRWHKIW